MSSTPYQVVFIQHEESSLYGELIQVMTDRSTVWLRPLALCVETPDQKTYMVFDVRNGPDIICPEYLYQPALDDGWLRLLEKMSNHQETCDFTQANQHLRLFLKALF
ncbi:MAG: hypothetical protein ACFBSF_09855 [Leptolyngbyaceae cyanobacterium]